MEKRVIAFIAFTAIAVGLMGILIVGLVVGWITFSKSSHLASVERDQLHQRIEAMTEDLQRREASGPGLTFDSWDALRSELDELIGKDRIALLARYSGTVPQMQIASPTTEDAIARLNEQSLRLAGDPEANVSLDTLYRYPVDQPERGTLAILLIDGRITQVEYTATDSGRTLHAPNLMDQKGGDQESGPDPTFKVPSMGID